MRKIFLFCMMILSVGCANISNFGPSGAAPGSILTNVTYPGENFNNTQYSFAKDDFQIVGTVHAQASSTSILGIVASGDSGYGKLYEEAKAQGADDVICVKVDTEYFNVLGIFSRVTSKLQGTAVKWVKK